MSTMEALGDEIDMGAFWRTPGERPIGATPVTASGAGGPIGFLGLSAAHVTASPPTMLVSIDRKTSAREAVLDSGHFAVNFLPEGTADLASALGGKGETVFDRDGGKALATGAPVLRTALGVFDCAVTRVVIEEGEIALVIGRVKAVRAAGDGTSLSFFRGKFLAARGHRSEASRSAMPSSARSEARGPTTDRLGSRRLPEAGSPATGTCSPVQSALKIGHPGFRPFGAKPGAEGASGASRPASAISASSLRARSNSRSRASTASRGVKPTRNSTRARESR